MMVNKSDVYKVGGGLLLGAAIGSAVGVLFAPKAGKETREDIKTKANEAQEKTQELIEQTKERAEQMYEKGRNVVTEKRDWALEAFNSGKEALIGPGSSSEQENKDKSARAAAKPKATKTHAAAS